MKNYIIIFFLVMFGVVPAINAKGITGHVDSVSGEKIIIRFDVGNAGSVGDIAEVTFVMIDGNTRVVGRWQIESVQGTLAAAVPVEFSEEAGVGQLAVIHDPKPVSEETVADDMHGIQNAQSESKVDGVKSISPQDSEVANFIREWLNRAEPLANANGADLRFDKWGRVEGRAVGGIITLHGSPDDVAGRTPEQYVWSKRDELDSLDHCTLGEYVQLKLRGESLSSCQKRRDSDMKVQTKETVTTVNTIVVPDLVKLSLADAMRVLNSIGLFTVPVLEKIASSESEEGMVYKQYPDPGVGVVKGVAVNLWVYNEFKAPVDTSRLVQNGQAAIDSCDTQSAGQFIAQLRGIGTTDSRVKADQLAVQLQAKSVQMKAHSENLQALSRVVQSGDIDTIKSQIKTSMATVTCPQDRDQLKDIVQNIKEALKQEARANQAAMSNAISRGQSSQREKILGRQQVAESIIGILTQINGAVTGAETSSTNTGQQQTGVAGGVSMDDVSSSIQQAAGSGQNNCAYDYTIKNISQFDCKCTGWGFDPSRSKCVEGFSNKYSSKPTNTGKVYAGFGNNSAGQSGGSHTCNNDSIRVDGEAKKYARIYGGGGTSDRVKGNVICYGNSYDEITTDSVQHYKCNEDNFGGCYVKSTSRIDSRIDLGGGAYKLVFDGGNSWWTIVPR